MLSDMKTIPIFRPGRHVSSGGAELEFTEADLEKSIAAYDPELHEAPIVVGHPKDNRPAYGWVSSISFAAGEVVAEAFLGAQPPAVKGLKDVAFTEDEEGVVEFADDAITLSLISRMIRGLRDTLLAKWGQDETEKALPGFLVEDLEAEARRAREEMPESFSESGTEPESTHPDEDISMTPEEIAALQEKAARAEELEAKVAEFDEHYTKLMADAKIAEFKSELSELVQQGLVLPAEVEELAQFMMTLSGEEAEEFAEGGKARSPLDVFRGMLKARPKAVEFAETASAADAPVEQSASDVAEKWVDLLGAFRVTYDFVIKTLSLDYELSDVISLTYQFPDEKGNTFYRFNLNDTRFRLTDIEEDYINNSVKLRVFG